jgi:hypothetical protein
MAAVMSASSISNASTNSNASNTSRLDGKKNSSKLKLFRQVEAMTGGSEKLLEAMRKHFGVQFDNLDTAYHNRKVTVEALGAFRDILGKDAENKKKDDVQAPPAPLAPLAPPAPPAPLALAPSSSLLGYVVNYVTASPALSPAPEPKAAPAPAWPRREEGNLSEEVHAQLCALASTLVAELDKAAKTDATSKARLELLRPMPPQDIYKLLLEHCVCDKKSKSKSPRLRYKADKTPKTAVELAEYLPSK